MPVFVTGGTGYIGRSVVRELRRRTHVVRALARSDAAARTLRELGAEPVRGELRDLETLRAEAAAADAVVHCAFDYSAQGVAFERAALEALLDGLRPGRAFVYTSGVWVYGSRFDAVVAEDAPLTPLELVAWRPAHEQFVLARAPGLRVVAIRPGTVYGDGGGIPGGLVAEAANGTLRIAGDGANRWPTIRHDALAELYGAVVDQRSAHGIYNATRGASVPYLGDRARGRARRRRRRTDRPPRARRRARAARALCRRAGLRSLGRQQPRDARAGLGTAPSHAARRALEHHDRLAGR